MTEERLQVAVAATEGGADACLYLGPKITQQFSAKVYFERNGYEFSLVPTPDNRLVFADERTVVFGDGFEERSSSTSGHFESWLPARRNSPRMWTAEPGAPTYVFDAISAWVAYHFHDTSLSAPVRRPRSINDNEAFRPNAENLAPFLYRIQQTDAHTYSKIRDIVRLAAPFFDDFKLRPIPATPDLIQLEWLQRGSDYPFRVNQLSDGTLRFVCLATALLQPQPPATVLFDEPELGLHPYALTLLGNLFKQGAISSGNRVSHQVIVSTQSALLLNEFAPEDVVVAERTNGESTFRRLVPDALSEWLEDYSLGELWQKNVLGGRPSEQRRRMPVNGGGDTLP
jgi:predicted ATPase